MENGWAKQPSCPCRGQSTSPVGSVRPHLLGSPYPWGFLGVTGGGWSGCVCTALTRGPAVVWRAWEARWCPRSPVPPRPRPRSPHCHPRGTSPPSAGLRSLPVWEDMAGVPWSPSGTRVLTWPANLHSPLGPASSTSWAIGRPFH